MKKTPDTLTDVQRAVRYFYLQKLGFGGRTSSRTFGTSSTGPARLNLITLEDSLLELHWRIKSIVIEHLPALDCIRRYDRPETLFYCDPPYYQTAGYAVPFCEQDFTDLRDTLAAIKGRFMVSLNDHPEVRRLFKAFNFKRLSVKYSASRSEASRAVPRSEVLITNF